MNKNYCEIIDEEMEDKNWYYVPPYGNEAHKILDSMGQLIGYFEEKEHALYVVELHNENMEYTQ